MKLLCTMMVVTIGILVVFMCSLVPVLAIDSLANNASITTPNVENSAPHVAGLTPSVSVTTATPTATPSATPTADNQQAAAPTDTSPSEANSSASKAPVIVAAAKPATVKSVTPATATVASQPDASSSLSVSILCNSPDGWQRLGVLYVWLCNSTGTVVSGFPVVMVSHPAPGSGREASYPVTIEFKYWYPWNPPGGTYKLKAIVYNTDGIASAPAYLGTYTYTRTTGFTFDTAALLDFGTLTFSETSSSQQTAIHNSGNGAIAVDAKSSDWTSTTPGASPVPVGSLQVSKEGTSWQPLTTSTASVQNMQILNGPPTSTLLYSRIVVPPETLEFVLAGQYTTIIILTVRPV